MNKSLSGLTVAELKKRIKLQEATITEEKAKAEALISSIGEGIIAIDEEGKIVQINQAALDILDFNRKDLLGKWFPREVVALKEDNSLIDPLDRPAVKVFLTGRAISEGLYYRKKDGNKIPVYLTASPIFLRGKPVGVIEVFRDISKDIQSDRLKTEFISLASHQLRTPLSTINLYAHMLKDGYSGKLTKGQTDLLKVVLSASSRMNYLINTLLNITRVEGGNISITSKPTDLDELLNELLTGFKPRIADKKITLEIKIGSVVPIVTTDRVIVGEILNNLISNSIKYTPDKGKISVALYKKGNNVEFNVKDNGYGIPKDSQDNIFTKFFRASNITSHDVTGTGLGLYFTKLLADKVNGEVWFKSKENSGSSFFFTVPISGNLPKGGKFTLQPSNE